MGGSGGAAVEGPGQNQFLRAARASGPVAVDGRLDEGTWAKAPVFDGFVQRFPDSGKAPTERTELRVLYDDRNVYFGITCHDSQPASSTGNLGRRDSDLLLGPGEGACWTPRTTTARRTSSR